MYMTICQQASRRHSPRNGSVFSMEVEVPRLLGTKIAWAVMGPKRNRLKQMYYLFKRKFLKNGPR